MTAKFVLRLLDESDQLLAWATVTATAKPQGRPRSCPFYADAPTPLVIERDGLATSLTIHWCDLDLARRGQPIEPVPVQVGQVMTFGWIEPVWLVPGSAQDVPLPTITERRAVTIGVPAGGIGLRA